jgi:hypothetical protein
MVACTFYAKKSASKPKYVNFLFTIPAGLEDKPIERYNKRTKSFEPVSTPRIVHEYNHTHNFVDAFKNILSRVRNPFRCRKAWRSRFDQV